VRRVWTEILAAVKRQRRTTQVLLESATVAGLDSGVLLLTMPSPALARRVTEPGNTDVLRAALREVLGVDWRVRCEAGDGSPASPTVGPPPAGSPTSRDERSAAPDAPRHQSSTATASTDPAARAEVPTDRGPEPDDDVDPYDEIDPDAPAAEVQDPEQVAIDLLASRLGARRLDPES